MSDPASLLQTVLARLLQAYQNGGSGSGASTLAFEPIGIPITPDMLKVNPGDTVLSPAIAVEELASLIDTVPHIVDGNFHRSMRTVEGAYELMLGGCSADSAASTAAVGTVRNEANQTFDDQLGSLLTAGAQYRPVTAIPSDWYDPAQNGNWVVYSTKDTTGTPPPVSTTTPVAPPLRWRVAAPPYVNVLGGRRVFFEASSDLPHAPIGASHTMPMAALSFRPAAASPLFVMHPTPILRTFQPPPAGVPVAPPPLRLVRPLETVQLVSAIAQSSTAQSVSSNLEIAFDYCIVLVDRPWLSEAMIESRGWYVPGYAAGGLASGNDTTGDSVFGLVPTAFVAIRNLNVSGTWTTADSTAVMTAASLGPFSLFGRSFDSESGVLTCNGMQIIAWVCEPQPALPPSSDPSLPPAPAVATAPPSTAPPITTTASTAIATATVPADSAATPVAAATT